MLCLLNLHDSKTHFGSLYVCLLLCVCRSDIATGSWHIHNAHKQSYGERIPPFIWKIYLLKKNEKKKKRKWKPIWHDNISRRILRIFPMTFSRKFIWKYFDLILKCFLFAFFVVKKSFSGFMENLIHLYVCIH